MVESHEPHPLQRIYSHARAARRALVERGGLSVTEARCVFVLSVLRGVLARRGARSTGDLSSHLHPLDLEAALGVAPHFASRARGQDRFIPPSELVTLVANDPTSLGWAYQFWNEAERDEATWGISRVGENVGVSSVTAATQVFTDDYMARFLVERCLSRLGAGGGSILDPACGAGHILAHAIRWLGNSTSLDALDILSLVHGCDIDPDAVEVCRVVVLLEILRIRSAPLNTLWETLQRQVQALDQPFGSLERAPSVEMLGREYSCVLTNPPYIGRRKMTTEMREFLDARYPDTRMDLCSAFTQRCVELVAPGGSLGLVTVDKWLRLKGYETLRTGGGSFGGLYNVLELDVVCELGARAFNSWSSLHDGVGTALLTARRERPTNDHEFHFISTSDYREPSEKARFLTEWLRREEGGQRVFQRDVCGTNGSAAFVARSGLPQGLTSARRAVADLARVLVGLQTSDDRSYVKHVWSVPPDKDRWLVHGKGGGYERWYGLNHFLLDWREGRPAFERDPKSGLSVERWFLEEGWTYTWFANGALGLRRKEKGWSFGRAASSGLFCDDLRLVAFLNSRVASLSVRRQGGKAQLPEGIVRSLPIPDSLDGIDPRLVEAAVAIKRMLVEWDVTDVTYRPGVSFDPLRVVRLQALLLVVEGELERQVTACVPLSKEEGRTLDATFGPPAAWSPCASENDRGSEWESLPTPLSSLENSIHVPRHDSLTPEESVAMVERFFAGGAKKVVAHRALPATSLVERICRSCGLHPFDVERALSSLVSRNTAVRREFLAPLVRQRVVADTLTLLGHQWWSVTERYEPSLHESRSVSYLADRVAGNLPGVDLVEALGETLDRWLATEAEVFQRRLMPGAPLLMVTRGGRAQDAMLSHGWAVPQLKTSPLKNRVVGL